MTISISGSTLTFSDGTTQTTTANTGGIITAGVIPRSNTIANGTTLSFNVDAADFFLQTNTQSAGTLTVSAPGGNPINGQKIIIRISSTAIQTFSWDPIFTGSTDLPLPTASTGSGKYDYLGFVYNSTASKWQLLAKIFGA